MQNEIIPSEGFYMIPACHLACLISLKSAFPFNFVLLLAEQQHNCRNTMLRVESGWEVGNFLLLPAPLFPDYKIGFKRFSCSGAFPSQLFCLWALEGWGCPSPCFCSALNNSSVVWFASKCYRGVMVKSKELVLDPDSVLRREYYLLSCQSSFLLCRLLLMG